MLVLLSGVSGAGKDTIKKELIKRMENVVDEFIEILKEAKAINYNKFNMPQIFPIG